MDRRQLLASTLAVAATPAIPRLLPEPMAIDIAAEFAKMQERMRAQSIFSHLGAPLKESWSIGTDGAVWLTREWPHRPEVEPLISDEEPKLTLPQP